MTHILHHRVPRDRIRHHLRRPPQKTTSHPAPSPQRPIVLQRQTHVRTWMRFFPIRVRPNPPRLRPHRGIKIRRRIRRTRHIPTHRQCPRPNRSDRQRHRSASLPEHRVGRPTQERTGVRDRNAIRPTRHRSRHPQHAQLPVRRISPTPQRSIRLDRQRMQPALHRLPIRVRPNLLRQHLRNHKRPIPQTEPMRHRTHMIVPPGPQRPIRLDPIRTVVTRTRVHPVRVRTHAVRDESRSAPTITHLTEPAVSPCP